MTQSGMGGDNNNGCSSKLLGVTSTKLKQHEPKHIWACAVSPWECNISSSVSVINNCQWNNKQIILKTVNRRPGCIHLYYYMRTSCSVMSKWSSQLPCWTISRSLSLVPRLIPSTTRTDLGVRLRVTPVQLMRPGNKWWRHENEAGSWLSDKSGWQSRTGQEFT